MTTYWLTAFYAACTSTTYTIYFCIVWRWSGSDYNKFTSPCRSRWFALQLLEIDWQGITLLLITNSYNTCRAQPSTRTRHPVTPICTWLVLSNSLFMATNCLCNMCHFGIAILTICFSYGWDLKEIFLNLKKIFVKCATIISISLEYTVTPTECTSLMFS